MLEELRTHLQQELRLPEIKSERCVHTQIEQASCRACVTHCPRQAWQLDDDSLKINIEACDGCGLCAPACTEGAILHSHEPLLRQFDQIVVALLACEKAELEATPGIVPCIHALSLHDLLKLYRQGVRLLIVATGQCTHCPRQPTQTLPTALIQINQALLQRNCTILQLQEVSADTWRTQSQLLKAPTTTEAVSRRHFFRRGLQSALKETLKFKGLLPQDQELFPPPGTLLPSSTQLSQLPYVPQIDPRRCNGCDTCFKICPHEVLLLDLENPAYVMVPEKCTGCQLCIDVCLSKAVTVTPWTIPTLTRLPLQNTRCPRCGAAFHRPVDYPNQSNLCHICTQVNHHRNLFQVME